jgi:hypothetical protein
LETTAIFFKVLQANVSRLASRDFTEEMKRLHSATVHVNPRLLSVGASEQLSSEVFAADIEEEASIISFGRTSICNPYSNWSRIDALL